MHHPEAWLLAVLLLKMHSSLGRGCHLLQHLLAAYTSQLQWRICKIVLAL